MLTNGHANVACALCHTNNNYSLTTTPNDCGNSGCHLTTWQQTKNPVHSTSGAQFAATNCAVCHTTVSWTTAVFDHSTTGFALIGTHLSPTPTPCASCHVNNNYTLSSADCYGCHQAAFQSTTTLGGNVPNHVTAGFPITASACATCHAITTWAAGVFNHSSTGFQLTNAHANVTCDLCHINNNYALTTTPTDCGNSGCHLTAWQQTTNPVHPTAGATFAAANCSTCHTTVSWTTATFDHSTTGFALAGTHMSPKLHPQFNGLLWVPPGSFHEHHNAWRERTEPRCGRISNHGGSMCRVPHDYYLGRGSFQSCYNWLRADQCPRQCNLCFVPHRQQLCFDDSPDGLRKFGMPLDDLAADQRPTACLSRRNICGSELCYLPHDGEFYHRNV